MADHLAEQLLAAAATAVTGLATTGVNVYRGRPDDETLQDTEIPALLLYLGDEEVELSSLDVPYVYLRGQQVVLAIRGAGTEIAINQIRKEVEIALAAALTVGGAPLRLQYLGLSRPQIDGSGELPVYDAQLTFVGEYLTRADAPDVRA